MSTEQQYPLLCCFFLLLLLPAHSAAATTSSFRAPESAVQQSPQGVAAEAMQDIIDIYGPLELPEPPPYLWYAAVAAAGISLALLIYLLRRRLKQKKETVADPTDTALAELNEAQALLPETGVADYCNKVADILRSYVEQRSGCRITRQTTTESLQNLKYERQHVIGGEQLTSLQNCFALCDRVKFARFTPDSEETELLGQLAHAFVSTTRTDQTGGLVP